MGSLENVGKAKKNGIADIILEKDTKSRGGKGLKGRKSAAAEDRVVLPGACGSRDGRAFVRRPI